MVFKKLKRNDTYIEVSPTTNKQNIFVTEGIYKSNKMRGGIFLFNLRHTQRARDATKRS